MPAKHEAEKPPAPLPKSQPIKGADDEYDETVEDSFPASDPPPGPAHIGNSGERK